MKCKNCPEPVSLNVTAMPPSGFKFATNLCRACIDYLALYCNYRFLHFNDKKKEIAL